MGFTENVSIGRAQVCFDVERRSYICEWVHPARMEVGQKGSERREASQGRVCSHAEQFDGV